MATFLAEAPCLRCVLTGVADFEAFSVVGMIRGPAEIDFVAAAGDGQRGRVVPTQRQEQRAVARGTCKDKGKEEKSGLAHTNPRSWALCARACFCRRNGHVVELHTARAQGVS